MFINVTICFILLILEQTFDKRCEMVADYPYKCSQPVVIFNFRIPGLLY